MYHYPSMSYINEANFLILVLGCVATLTEKEEGGYRVRHNLKKTYSNTCTSQRSLLQKHVHTNIQQTHTHKAGRTYSPLHSYIPARISQIPNLLRPTKDAVFCHVIGPRLCRTWCPFLLSFSAIVVQDFLYVLYWHGAFEISEAIQ